MDTLDSSNHSNHIKLGSEKVFQCGPSEEKSVMYFNPVGSTEYIECSTENNQTRESIFSAERQISACNSTNEKNEETASVSTMHSDEQTENKTVHVESAGEHRQTALGAKSELNRALDKEPATSDSDEERATESSVLNTHGVHFVYELISPTNSVTEVSKEVHSSNHETEGTSNAKDEESAKSKQISGTQGELNELKHWKQNNVNTNNRVVLEGYLKKKGDFIWSTRWFQLWRKELHYFDRLQDSSTKSFPKV